MIPPPSALGLIVCDRVENNPQTRKMSLVGLIMRFAVPRFPGYPDPFSIFASLKGSHGRHLPVGQLR